MMLSKENINTINSKPISYIGCTGIEYSYDEYINHGYGGIYKGFKDLPKDQYPYTLKYILKT